MKKATILFLPLLLLFACQSDDKPQTITVENRYTLSVPSFLTKVTELHQDASLQYQNALKDFYVIVIDEPKAEMEKALEENGLTELYAPNVKGYSDLLLGVMETSMPGSKKSVIRDTVINKMPARMLSLTGKVKNMDVYYTLGFYEGKEHFYQVLTWTAAKQEAEYKDEMAKIIRSLKEV